MLRAATPLTLKLEREWDADLFASRDGLAPTLGWRSYHTLRAKGSQSGYPDRTIWRERTIFAELKRELTGKKSEDANRRPKPAQVSILDGLSRAGSEVYLWRPSDLDEIARILGKPWVFLPYTKGTISFDTPPRLGVRRGDGCYADVWVPKSIWLPGAGRADEAGAA